MTLAFTVIKREREREREICDLETVYSASSMVLVGLVLGCIEADFPKESEFGVLDCTSRQLPAIL